MTSMPLAGTPSPQAVAGPPSLSELAAKIPLLAQMQDQQQKNKWAAWVDQEFEKCKSTRTAYERQWYINLAFYSGRQYIAPMDVPNRGFRLVSPQAPPHKVRLVINKIRTAVRTETAKLASSKPIPIVVPATTEDEDYMAARVGEQLLKSKFAHDQFQAELRMYLWWGAITGASFMKTYWDPNAVDEEAQLPPQKIMMMGQQIGEQPAEVVKGKICVEHINPFHIWVPDMLSIDLEDQPYLIHAMTRTPLWVKNTFGMNATPDSMSTNTVLESAVLGAKGHQQANDSVLVKEMWIKPHAHPDFPEGGMITVINGKVVQASETWPWPFKDFPFMKYEGIPTGGFYTESNVTDLVPLQKAYNETKSRQVEINRLMGHPRIMYAQGSVDMRKVSTDPRQGIPYTPGFNAPQVLPPIPPSTGFSEDLDRIIGDFDDISGQHEITRGNTPAQVTSGTAIAFLQEQDDSKLHYQVAGLEGAMQKLGRQYLKFVATYWTEERIIKVTGLDNAYEAKHWKGSDLRGNTDVRIQAGSALPESRAAKQALITEFMTNGWLDPVSGMEILDFGGFSKLMEDFLTDKRQAQRENVKLADMDVDLLKAVIEPPVGPGGEPMVGPDGQPMDPVTGMPHQPQPPMPVNSWDNHEVHIHIHNQFRKTQQFELLDPVVKQAFELHVQLHQLALMGTQIGAAGLPLNAPEGASSSVPPPESGEPSGGPANNFGNEAEGEEESSLPPA